MDTSPAGLTAEDVRNVVTDVVAQPLADGAASTDALRGDVSNVLDSVHDLSLQVSESFQRYCRYAGRFAISEIRFLASCHLYRRLDTYGVDCCSLRPFHFPHTYGGWNG